MKTLIGIFCRRPVTVIMIILAILMGGIHSILNLPLDKMPNIIFPRVTVETLYPGMGASEIRSTICIPLEDSLSSVKGLENIQSISRDGSSLIILSFRWGTNPIRAAILVREVIDTVYPGLPHGVIKPTVISGDPFSTAHAIVTLRSLDGITSARNFAEYDLRARLRSLEGIASVNISGGVVEEIYIHTDIERLLSRSIDINSFAEIISYETRDYPAGNAREGNRELTIIGSGRPESEQELSSLVIPSSSGPIRMEDLASVHRQNARRQSLSIYNGNEQVALEIFRREGFDPVKLSANIRTLIDEYDKLFSNDFDINLVYDSSPSIVKGLSDLGKSGLFAALAVIILLTLFFGRFNYSFLAALSIPVSASISLIFLFLSGRSLNAMSLGGLALGIGLVSDTSVVVLDLYHRNFSNGNFSNRIKDAITLTSSVSISSMSGSLTSMIVFIPVIFLPGALGALFGDLAFSLIFSVASGWIYAQYFLPGLFCFFSEKINSRKKNMSKKRKHSSKMEKFYGFFLRFAMRNPLKVYIFSFLFCLGGFSLLLLLPMEFIASDKITELELIVDFPNGTHPDAALEHGINISNFLSDLSFLDSHFGFMGAEYDDMVRRSNPDYRRERLLFRCFLNDSLPAGAAMDNLQRELKDYVFNNYSAITIPFSINANYPPDRSAQILGLSSSMTFAIKGYSTDEAMEKVSAVEDYFNQRAGNNLEFLNIRPSGTRSQIRLSPRREEMAISGISSSQIAASVYAASTGIKTGNMEINGRQVDIRLSSGFDNYDQILMLPILRTNASSESIPVFLGSIADISWIEKESVLLRQDRSDVYYMDFLPASGGDLAIQKLMPEILGIFDGVKRADESVFLRYRSSLFTSLILVLLLLYLLLGAQFESFILPVILLMSVPFSLAGAGPALFFSGSILDSGTVLGLIALFGLSVNNGIIFYEISEELFYSGQSIVLAVYKGALLRFRPVLLTSLTAILALFPLIISPMGNTQRSMAFTMLGGIVVSGIFAFFIFPPVFVWFFRNKGCNK